MWSETQPKNGRVSPLVMRSTVSASGSAAKPSTITLATPKSRANGANCEMIMRPPVDIMVIITNISQKTPVRSISPGATSLAASAMGGGGGDRILRVGHAHRQGGGGADDAEDPSEYDQRALMARAPEHVVDRKGREDRAEPITGRDQAGRKAAPIREPAHHQADDADIDDAGADAAKTAHKSNRAG